MWTPRRWPGTGDALWSLSLLLLSFPGSSMAQLPPSCPTGAPPQDLYVPAYHPVQTQDINSEFMSPVVQSFLSAVQPNPFPKDLVIKVIEDPNPISDEVTVKSVLEYETGFLVGVAIGVLFIILMPLIGLFFACCRCCGNCGGHMYQKQTSRIHCKRICIYWSTFVITSIILAGNICMFFSNESTHQSVEGFSTQVHNTLANLQIYLSAIPEQFDQVLTQSVVTVDEVTNNLNGIGPLLGSEIQRRVEGPLRPALDSVMDMSQEVDSTSALLQQLNATLERLQPELGMLQQNLSSVRDRINTTLQSPDCRGCSVLQPELDRLTVDTTLNLGGLREVQSAVAEAQRADLPSQVQEGEDFFRSIPQRVTNETRESVQSAQRQLQSIKAQISQLTSDIPLDTLESVHRILRDFQGTVNDYSPAVEHYELIRWSVALALCCVVLLVVVCNILGLLLGPAGLNPKDDPIERSGTADCGGRFLLAGVGFSFLFSWILMLLVLLLFLVGGNSYALVCKPLGNRQLFQIIDTPGVIPGFNLSQTLGVKANLTLGGIYMDCKQNKALWRTLHLEDIIDLNQLNVSKYMDEIEQAFNSSDIRIPTVTLLSPEVMAQLQNFSQSTSGVNFSTVYRQISTFSEINLNTTADQLDQLAAVQSDPAVNLELRAEASELRAIQREITHSIMPLLTEVNSTLRTLEASVPRITATVKNVLETVTSAQAFLNINTTQTVESESQKFLLCQLGHFTVFVDWAKVAITQEVGRCGPVSQAVDAAETLLCSRIVESVNAFWFSMGWCIMFFIPSIILSVKLAKYYRRMKHSDAYDDQIMMNHIPRANIKPY